MGPGPLRAPATLREAIVERLRNDIITGVLKPGELLKEVELAVQLGLSPTPIREALVQLADQGLVEIEPNRLKRVSPLNLPTLRDLMAVQRVLWQTGYSWGAPRVGLVELASMHDALMREAEALDEGNCRAAFLASSDFHGVVVAASGNSELMRLITDRFALIERLVVLRMRDLIFQKTLKQDQAIFLALKQGDVALALCYGEGIRAEFAEALAALADEF